MTGVPVDCHRYYLLRTLYHTRRTATLLSTIIYQVLFTLNINILVQLWVAGEGPTMEWSYLRRKVVREETILPS